MNFLSDPVNFISQFRGYFIAVQSTIDHVQPDNEHTILLTNLATHARYGGSGRCVWTRVNSATGWTTNSPNQTYSLAAPPQWLSEQVSIDAAVQQYLDELVAMAPLPAPGDFDGDGDVDSDDFDTFAACATGPAVGPPPANCLDADFDHDNDVDQSDFGLLRRCLDGKADRQC